MRHEGGNKGHPMERQEGWGELPHPRKDSGWEGRVEENLLKHTLSENTIVVPNLCANF